MTSIRFAQLCFIFLAICFLSLETLASSRTTLAGDPCPQIASGPWAAVGIPHQDYRDPSERARANLANVQRHHFTTKVENLQAGKSGSLISDINYTLRAFPNHHKALYALMRYSWKNEGKAFRSFAPTECHFQRALSIFNDDPIIHQMYGVYLHKAGKLKEALEQYQAAEQLQPNSSELSYNMGLLYTELKDYPNARKYAEKAYTASYPLPGLRKKLKRLGEWLEEK